MPTIYRREIDALKRTLDHVKDSLPTEAIESVAKQVSHGPRREAKRVLRTCRSLTDQEIQVVDD